MVVSDGALPRIIILGRMKRNAVVILSVMLRRFTRHGIKIWRNQWRLVGAIKGDDEILFLGRSTAFLVAVVAWLRR